jgi:hypothetical protein
MKLVTEAKYEEALGILKRLEEQTSVKWNSGNSPMSSELWKNCVELHYGYDEYPWRGKRLGFGTAYHFTGLSHYKTVTHDEFIRLIAEKHPKGSQDDQ